MSDVLGYVGAVSLALCALPLLIQTMKDGHARGVNAWFLILWLTGEITMLGHVILSNATAPLILNYAANVAMVGAVAAIKAYS